MPSNQSKMMQVFSGQARMLATPVVYVDFMGGSHAGALFLSQLIFWSDKGGKKDGWFYKSYKEWDEEVRLSRHHVNKFSQALVEAGVLETQLRKANGFPTLHYKLDMDKLTIAFCEFLQKGNEDDSDMRKVANPFVNFRKTITEDYIQNTEAEKDNYVIFTNDEKPSSDTPPDSVSTVKVSGSDVVKVNSAGALHNVAQSEPAVAPDLATLVAEILPAEPTPPVTVKVKKAANPKAAPPPKQPKEPRTLTYDELTLLKRVDALEPGLCEQVEERIRKYPRSQPWSVSQVYLLTGIRVAKTLWPTVTSLNGVAFEEEKLLTCYKAWLAMGYNPHGLNWLLDWYKAGGPPARYGQQAQQQQPAPTPSKPKLDISDPLVVDFEHWITALPGYGSKSPRSIQLAAWLATNGDYNVAAQHIGDIEELYAEYQATH